MFDPQSSHFFFKTLFLSLKHARNGISFFFLFLLSCCAILTRIIATATYSSLCLGNFALLWKRPLCSQPNLHTKGWDGCKWYCRRTSLFKYGMMMIMIMMMMMTTMTMTLPLPSPHQREERLLSRWVSVLVLFASHIGGQ